MRRFQQVNTSVRFTLSATAEQPLDEIYSLVEKRLWSFLLTLAAENNMSVSRPEIEMRTNSDESD